MLFGERVRLRAMEKSDLSLCVKWINDPAVREGINIYFPFSMRREESWFEQVANQAPEETPMIIEIQEKDGWFPIGTSAFVNYMARERNAEYGIFIGEKEYWHKGYGEEVTRLMLRFGFSDLNLQRIYLKAFDTNPRAIRCYENAGFVHEGRLRQAGFQNGKYIDLILMSVLFPEWQEGEQL